MSAHCDVIVRQKFYLDSVALMRYSQALVNRPDVIEAAMMMGTPSNVQIMHNAGLIEADAVQATPADLIIAVRAKNKESVLSALTEAATMLDAPTESASASTWQPKSMRSAVAANPNANLALVSVPGAFAVGEARKALRRGLNVMIFSDNVAIEQEAELKREAHSLNRIVMGPDCGTAIINGVPLAFANKVPRGNIAIIGASGTGIQEVSCLIAQRGQGISQAIGVGGRDLHESVGGISTLMALDALERDDNTAHIVVISKPPAESIASLVLDKLSQSKKSITVCFLGGEKPALPANCGWASNLTDAAVQALRSQSSASDNGDATKGLFAVTAQVAPHPKQEHSNGFIRGLYCGGTLCTESLLICRQANVTLSSNIAMSGVEPGARDNMHLMIDLGADEFTQGKPHPMIEPTIRDAHIQAALEDNQVTVLLLDLVIGYGAHADPATVLVNALATGKQRDVKVIASVTGTNADPQNRASQVAVLEQAGIEVAPSNAAAAFRALDIVHGNE